MHARTEATMEGLDEQTIAWAEQLASRLQQAHVTAAAAVVPVEEWIRGAIAALWTLWDDAVVQATAALAQAGLPERILTLRSEHEYRLEIACAEGEPRRIWLFAGLRTVDGHASGGAQITTSSTRATIYLVPSVDGGCLRWRVPATGTEFTARVVDDLLLSVFANDPAATCRVGPYFSIDESF